MKESDLIKQILIQASQLGSRLFRNNVGLAWTGTVQRFHDNQTVRVKSTDILIRNFRPFHAGLVKGSGDCIGFTPLIVTESMVGKTVAVFTSTEVKTNQTRTTPEQLAFHETVKSSGGISLIVKSLGEFTDGIREYVNGK